LRIRLWLPALILLSCPLAGQTAYRVEDLVTGQVGYPSDPKGFLTVGSKVFFTAESGSGRELYATDGSSAGTQLLADVCPGLCGSDPVLLGAAGGVLFFSAEPVDRESSIVELWRSDGTRKGTFPLIRGVREHAFAGGSLFFSVCERVGFACDLWKTNGAGDEAVLVKDLNPQPFDGNRPEHLTAVGNRVVFVARGPAFDPALWASDGTDAGTSMVRDFGRDVSSLVELTAAGSKVFFVAHGREEELWVSDGTAAGTVRMTDFENPAPLQGPRPQALGGELFFLADDVTHGREIWRSDGTVQGTRRATGIGYHQPFGNDPFTIERLGSRLVFLATDGIRPRRLWAVSGTPESAAPLEGCLGGCPESAEGPLVRVGSRILFWGMDADHGLEPWSTDGTAGGTVRLADVCPGPCTPLNFGTHLVVLLGAAFFAATEDDLSDGKTSLWRSDGTPAGTKRFAGPDPAIVAQVPAALGGRLVFAASDEVYGREPWTSDGTPGGTRLIADVQTEAAFFQPRELAALGSRVLFQIDGGGFCQRVWHSAGIPGDIAPLTDCRDTAEGLTPSGGLIYFWVDEDFHSPQVWATDGTPGGTRPLSPEFDTARSGLFPLVPFQGRVYVLTDPGFSLPEIWRIDGGGAAKLDLLPGDGVPFRLGSVADRLYFVTSHQELGIRLWRSDGLSSWTPLVPPGFISWSVPRVRAGGWDYFTGQTYDANGSETALWKTDGTAAGTVLVRGGFENDDLGPSHLAEHQGSLFFFAREKGSFDWSLWKSDGTAAGTQLLRTFARPFDEPPPGPVSFGPYLYFAANDQVHGRELWRTDGTPAGTVLVRDLYPGEQGSRIGELAVAGGKLFFTGHDGIHGEELWQTGGTEAGTRLVHDVNPLSESSYPADLTAAGERLFFVADDGLAGRELWALPLAPVPAGCHPSATALCLSQGRFKVEVSWRDFQGNTGTGKAVPLTADTGYFWFFDAGNVEVMIKVLNGQGLNGHHWVFYGALSSVEYTLTVTDTQTGLTRHYFNPLNQFASVGDTNGFGPLGAYSSTRPVPSVRSFEPAAGICEPSATRLCLQGGRFAVEAEWKDFAGKTGKGQAVGLTGDTGYLWFFDAANVEVVVKVLDGRPVNGRFWVFYGALSSVEYSLKVTDTQTGEVRTYKNPSGRLASSGDTTAF
jgi:ELWxxDGT repeat protein